MEPRCGGPWCVIEVSWALHARGCLWDALESAFRTWWACSHWEWHQPRSAWGCGRGGMGVWWEAWWTPAPLHGHGVEVVVESGLGGRAHTGSGTSPGPLGVVGAGVWGCSGRRGGCPRHFVVTGSGWWSNSDLGHFANSDPTHASLWLR
jgi:hypothetical protein